jgi:hypothetical protein
MNQRPKLGADRNAENSDSSKRHSMGHALA